MINYLIISIVLSIAGFVVYKLYSHNNANYIARKRMLFGIIGLALILPLCFNFTFGFFNAQQSSLFSEFSAIEHGVAHAKHQGLDPELMVCYERAVGQTGFCHCEKVTMTNMVMYKSNGFYDFLNGHLDKISFLFVGITLLFIIIVLVRLYLLNNIVKKATRTIEKTIDGLTVQFLYVKQRYAVGSFKLQKNYIIWSSDLDQLTKDEQQSIIAHEVLHLKKRHSLEQLLLALINCYWFINPVVYLIKREAMKLNEFMADAAGLEQLPNKKAYASLLLKVKTGQQLAMVNSFNKNMLKIRVQEIIKSSKRVNTAVTTMAFCLMFAMLFSISLFAENLTQKQHKQMLEYTVLQKQVVETGRDYFCGHCLYEECKEE